MDGRERSRPSRTAGGPALLAPGVALAALLPALVVYSLACGGEGRTAAGNGAVRPASGAPDVVLVTLDTLRYDALGFTGNPRAETPLLDRLAAAGRRFPDAHAHSVVTLPSHANILTGRYPYEHGVRDNTGFVLGPELPTLATLLAGAGYATGAFVGAFPLDDRFGLGRGFAVYDDRYPEGSSPDRFVIAERRGDAVVAAARDWWRVAEGRPRFLWVHLYDPHAPYAPAEPFASRFAGEPYLGEVAAVDAYLAPLLAPLLDGAPDDALVVVTSDHGEALGDHGEVSHGLFAYEATLRVPLVLWGSGVEPGVDARAAAHVDILPTVLDAVGIAAPPGLPGRSLLAPPDAPGRGLYFEALSTYLNRGWAPLKGVLRDGVKLIHLPLPELYDLATDPAEADNLFDRNRRQAAELARELPEEAGWPPRPSAVSAEVAAQLRGLGYLSGPAPAAGVRFTAEDDPKRLVGLDRKLHRFIDLYSRGQLEEAAAAAREVIAERPSMAVGHQHLAIVLRRLGRTEEAVAVLEEALRRGVDPSSLGRDLGLSLAEIGRTDDAIRLLEPLAAAGDLESLVALGNAYFLGGRLEPAREAFGAALEGDAGDAGALEGMGAVALAAGRPDLARGYLERALAQNGELPIALNSLGVALYQLGDAAGALDAWERSAELDPGQLDALFNLGLVAAERGESERARRALERFVAAAPRGQRAADLSRARALLTELRG